jgi:hypothetical protein
MLAVARHRVLDLLEAARACSIDCLSLSAHSSSPMFDQSPVLMAGTVDHAPASDRLQRAVSVVQPPSRTFWRPHPSSPKEHP